jgi:hypothetical protein
VKLRARNKPAGGVTPLLLIHEVYGGRYLTDIECKNLVGCWACRRNLPSGVIVNTPEFTGFATPSADKIDGSLVHSSADIRQKSTTTKGPAHRRPDLYAVGKLYEIVLVPSTSYRDQQYRRPGIGTAAWHVMHKPVPNGGDSVSANIGR